jgi:predicted permease
VNGADTFGSFAYPVYAAMRDNATGFSDLACWLDLGEARPVVLGELGFGVVQFVSGNFFRTVGVRAHVGRTIEPTDDGPVSWSAVAMVSHRFWQRAFGRDPNVTRKTLQLNGRQFAVVGVIPEHFSGLDPAISPDVIVPIGAIQIAAASTNPLQNPRFWNPCRVVGRRASRMTDREAAQELEGWAAEAIRAQPPTQPYDPPRILLLDGSRGLGTLRDATSVPLVMLLVVVGGLLLATCANLAGLLLARAGAREREIATRLALGAARSRIVRQLLTESLVLSAAGGALGVLVAYWATDAGSRLLSQFMPTLYGQDRSLTVQTALDVRVLVAAIAITIVSGLLFGMLPAVRAAQLDLISVIRRTHGGERRRFRVSGSQAMVFVEAVLAMVLLMGAGLLLRTVVNLRNAERGINPDGVIYARVEPRSGGMANEHRQRFFEDAVKRLQVIPGVASASAGATVPMGGAIDVGIRPRVPVCSELIDETTQATAAVNSVLPGFFDVLGVKLVAGRPLTWSDNQPKLRNVVVNQTFAARYLGPSAAGQVVRIGQDCSRQVAEFNVVGIVADVREPREAAEPTVYFPLLEFGGTVTLMVRTTQDAASLIPTIRRAMRELNAQVPTFSEAALVDLRERQLRRERLLTSLLTVFGVATLLVCCIGIYGMLSYAVTRRRSEISVRMAIGAPMAGIVAMIVRESIVAVGAGIVVGAMLVVAFSRWLNSVLFGVSALDPWILGGATFVLVVVASGAAALPARAAARVDPVLALRQ